MSLAIALSCFAGTFVGAVTVAIGGRPTAVGVIAGSAFAVIVVYLNHGALP